MQENNLSEHFKKSLITLTDLAKVAILDDYKSSLTSSQLLQEVTTILDLWVNKNIPITQMKLSTFHSRFMGFT